MYKIKMRFFIEIAKIGVYYRTVELSRPRELWLIRLPIKKKTNKNVSLHNKKVFNRSYNKKI